MVNLQNFVLDEGILKSTPEVKMTKMKTLYDYFLETKFEVLHKNVWENDEMVTKEIRNEKFKEMTPRMKYAEGLPVALRAPH